ncbi:hypothetical protein CBS101457_002568 [Exobasidium rhododendri]|nr:hypothetical protein CBS101457_002568 [Exobasidium rhododendri]
MARYEPSDPALPHQQQQTQQRQQQNQNQNQNQNHHRGLSSQGRSLTSSSLGSSKTMSSGSDYMGKEEFGPYSHLQNGSMGTLGAKWKGPPTKMPTEYARNDQKYNIAIPDNTHMYYRNQREADDYLHEPDGKRHDTHFVCCSPRGFLNVSVLGIVTIGLVALFAGYPIISHFTTLATSKKGAFALGGTNGTGQVPVVFNNLNLIDTDTPSTSKTWTSPKSKDSYHLVFSDEFDTDGRTFWPGDDPFWTAVDLWYGATGDYEWYTPEQINTTNGHLQITLENKAMHNLNFRSGMLQSWNKFCFQGGYIEFSVVLPGAPDEVGWWPGLWTMGNLARPGYLGTTDGMWPYSYNECDSGILKNQTAVGRTGYNSIVTSTKYNKVGLNWLNGMRTPACTCSDDDHPGPNKNVGRSAPELDILEAQIKQKKSGQASQSMQIAPFDLGYDWNQTVADIYDPTLGQFNSYTGSVYQEAVSATSPIPDTAYANSGNQFTTYGMEYTPDFNGDGSGTITWYVAGTAVWTVNGASVPPRPEIDIGQRLVPVEPMSIIMNLGMSRGFQADLDFDTLTYPAVMKVDYVRVYQNDANAQDLVSCDPVDYPTSAYINKHIEVYTNINHTVWPFAFPANKLTTGC